jgi:HEAT repeat protein
MMMPIAPLGASRASLADVKRGAVVLATALLMGHGDPLHAAPAEQAPPELRTQVLTLLEQPDAFPPYEARWRPLGPEALGILEELVSNPETPPPQRARAVTSMAAVDAPQATDYLRTLLKDAHTQPPLRASAATALSLRGGSETIPTLLPFLQDRHSPVRVAVAHALGRLGGPLAQQALEEAIPSEEDPLVREALQQGLTFLEP